MNNDPPIDLVTGAFSYSGSAIAERLLGSGRRVRTFTFHPQREHHLQARVETFPYRFDDPAALTRSLDGVTTLYNTYWVRFDHGQTRFADAIENSRILFSAAERARVERIVHVSIANPSIDSPLPYEVATAPRQRKNRRPAQDPCDVVGQYNRCTSTTLHESASNQPRPTTTWSSTRPDRRRCLSATSSP